MKSKEPSPYSVQHQIKLLLELILLFSHGLTLVMPGNLFGLHMLEMLGYLGFELRILSLRYPVSERTDRDRFNIKG